MAAKNMKIRNVDILHVDDFISTLIRKVLYAQIDLSDTDTCFDFLQEENIIESKEQNYLRRTDSVPMALMIKILMLSFSLFPYPSGLYCFWEIEHKAYSVRAEPYEWTWMAAYEMGLVSRDMNPNEPATKPQLKELLRKLETEDHGKLPKPAAAFRNLDLVPTETTRRTWEWRNGIILGLQEIPESYLDMFRDMNWEFTYDSFQVTKNCSNSASKYVGQCNHKTKKIHIIERHPYITIHEMGHFIIGAMDARKEQQELFQKEGTSAFPYLRSYAQTNAGEYFAVFWETWVGEPGRRKSLQCAAPETAAFVKALLAC